jgi:predicted transcriptional regulator of viral defense system
LVFVNKYLRYAIIACMTERSSPKTSLLQSQALLRPSDAVALGYSRMYVAQLAKQGLVRKISRGLYATPQRQESEFSSFAEIASKHPKALVCLVSALSFHGLTTQAPHEVWIAIGNKDRIPTMTYPPLRVVRFGGESLTEGVALHMMDGVEVKVTNIAKTIADCFKFRNKIGLDIALEALKEAVQSKRVTMDELWHYSQLCRVHNVMRPYLEGLAA